MVESTGTAVIWLMVALLVGALSSFFLVRMSARNQIRLLEERTKERIKTARREADQRLEDLKSKAELELERRRLTLEQEMRERESSLKSKEDEAVSALLNAEKERDAAERRREELERRLEQLEKRELQTKELASEYRNELQRVSRLSEEQARENLRIEVERDCEEEIRQMRQDLVGRGERDVQKEARRVLIDAMQRLSSQSHHDVTATIVRIPSEDMKGRIIGREGRNIKSFESVTGTTLLIDETPDSVLVSSFDPVRREVARIALEALIRDGRIHPSSIEESVRKAEEEVKQSVTELGEEALRRLRLNKVHPEVISLLGRLRYRLSNNQNSLDHSIEVANLCALMAAELGLDVEIAKRCGLLHDIGKVLDEEYPGSHAVAGANFLKRYGNEDPRVINAVAAHHGEAPAESEFVPLIMMADSISAMRPGARAESIDSYIQRVRNLEQIAKEFDGVADAYAIQAGREIRVVVAPDRVRDEDAKMLARKIRRRIESELQYPGTIKVTVIRECRVSETAK